MTGYNLHPTLGQMKTIFLQDSKSSSSEDLGLSPLALGEGGGYAGHSTTPLSPDAHSIARRREFSPSKAEKNYGFFREVK